MQALFLSASNWVESLRLFDIKVLNVGDFSELVLRLALVFVLFFIIIHFIYSKNSNRKDYYFSFFAVGMSVFLLCFLLNSVKLELGFALGLFAIFGIIRYRTDAIPIKEMTYMFIVIAVAVVNALANKKVSYMELLLTNAVIVFGLWLLEKRLILRTEKEVHLTYEKIENIHASNAEKLIEDLRSRTGINIHRFEIRDIDFLRDIAKLTVYYYENGNSALNKQDDEKK